jgi:hypothetical protein
MRNEATTRVRRIELDRVLLGMPNKMTRRSKAEIQELKQQISTTLENYHPQTVRQLFYQLVGAGAIPKTEAAYQGVVVRLCGQMREAGELPWDWIADSTRWMRKPDSYSSVEEALRRTKETYRRDLWADQRVYVEVWVEKEALAGVLYEITQEWDVPLMVVKGFPSKDFVHGAAQAIELEDKPAYLYYFGDQDPSGLWIWRDVQRKIRRYAPEADVTFERVAVTLEQIKQYRLPTRPTKREGNSHAKNFRGQSVEVDALPPVTLQALVRGVIEQHVDTRQLRITKVVEQSERERLTMLASTMANMQVLSRTDRE